MEKRKIRSSGKMIFPQTNFFSYFLILKNDTENHFVTQVSFLIPFFFSAPRYKYTKKCYDVHLPSLFHRYLNCY